MRAWRFSSVGDGPPVPKSGAERLAVGVEDRADRDHRRSGCRGAAASVARVAQAALRRVGPRHRHAEDAVAARAPRPRASPSPPSRCRPRDRGRRSRSRTCGRSPRGRGRARAAVPGTRGELGRGRAAAARRRRSSRSPPRNGGRRRPGGRCASKAVEAPSKTRSSLPPTRLQCTSGTPRAPGDPLHHAAAQAVLAERVGRGRDVDVRGRARSGELGHRIGVVEGPLPERLVVPDVLADRDGHAPARDAQDERAVARLEVAALVEDVVGRQQALAVEGDAPSSARGDGGVEDAPAARATVGDERAEDPGRLRRRRGRSDPPRARSPQRRRRARRGLAADSRRRRARGRGRGRRPRPRRGGRSPRSWPRCPRSRRRSCRSARRRPSAANGSASQARAGAPRGGRPAWALAGSRRLQSRSRPAVAARASVPAQRRSARRPSSRLRRRCARRDRRCAMPTVCPKRTSGGTVAKSDR